VSFEILNNPIYSIVQDNGNFNNVHLGVSVSGAMDEYAYNIANLLLNNNKNTNILEINFSNLLIKVHKEISIAITGAECEFFINGTQYSTWQVFQLKKDDIINVGKFLTGARVYLSVKNGFIYDTNSVKENEYKLKKSDILNYHSTKYHHNRLKKDYIPIYSNELTLRVIFSYQENYFSNTEKIKFLSSNYIVSNEISRMGYKLKGKAINCTIEGIISEGIAYGSIQIPKDGQPIILLKDRQTIGGYPKIGVILDIDCYKLSQARPNTIIKFQEISINDAVIKSKQFHKSISKN
jgi:biotin-dependent carboxylase-like uncharacterized protein